MAAQPSSSTAPVAAPPRIAVVGTGYWGRNLLRNFDALGALAALYDADASARADFAGKYPNAKAPDSLDALLADDSIDAVAISSPAATHGPLTAQALAAGKHVFVEKPLCLDLDEAERLRGQAQASGLQLMVGHMLLYHPAFQALSDLVAAGGIGTLRYIYSNRCSLGKIRMEENALWSFAPHDISMILALTGAMPERVVCSGGTYLSPPVADTTLSHLTFPGGVQAHIFVSWLHPYKDHRMVVVGSSGMVVFNDVQAGPEKLLLYRHEVGWAPDKVPSVVKADAEPVPYGDEEPLRAECRHFVDSLTGGSVPTSDAAEGIRVLTVLDACQRALKTGQPMIPGHAEAAE